MFLIIGFRTNVEGVLLACLKLRQLPDAHLVYAKDLEELRRKIDFAGVKRDLEHVGFEPVAIAHLAEKAFGKHWYHHVNHSCRKEPDLIHYIDLVLRHAKCEPSELVRNLSSSESVTSLYSGKTQLQRKCYRYMREVRLSYHRLCMFARPSFVRGILTAEIKPEHRVEDMFCRWLAKKNPDLPVAVVHGDKAWIGNGNFIGLDRFMVVTSSFLGDLTTVKKSDDVEDLWDVYYDSQMIDSRRNKKQAKKFQPWSASSASGMSMKDRYKVERGISPCKLGDFFEM
ncbi:DUF4130 domain-containing protein [Methanomethylovorans sp.]|uniref:DUF4130 domain-containing protein n=1 Tax=Methanomethylovorans sp. TaxID=2758717 RepID=UPI000A6B73EF|nr:DUF4130 domain-containing protein [Methanomethylovorans sp.]